MIHSSKIAIAVVVFAIAQMGCASTRGGGAAAPAPTKPSDQICFTRSEIARIQAFKVRCRSKVDELRAKAKHDLVAKDQQHKAAIKTCQVRLKGCYEQGKAKQSCPACLAPIVVVGVAAGAVGMAVGIAVGVVVAQEIKP